MKDTLETLRDGLLVFSVVLLVYVLYKRLLKILGKKERSTKYPTLGENLVWTDSKNATLEIILEEKSRLLLSVYENNGTKKQEIAEGEYPVGTHVFPINLSSLPAGRYYLKVISDHQEASRYFDLV